MGEVDGLLSTSLKVTWDGDLIPHSDFCYCILSVFRNFVASSFCHIYERRKSTSHLLKTLGEVKEDE